MTSTPSTPHRRDLGVVIRRRPAVALLASTSLACAVAVAVAGAAPAAQDDTGGTIEQARTTIDRWVDIRRTISRERAEWTLRRETLGDRIALVEGEIARMKEQIAELNARVDETEGSRADLARENEALKDASGALTDGVASLESRMRLLLPRLPDPVREKVQMLSQRMPPEAEPGADASAVETRLSLGERFQNIIGILNEVNRANGEVTARTEIRTLPDGVSSEVTTVYVGLGHAFFLSTAGMNASRGSSTADGWLWTPADDARDAIATVIAILRNEQPAAFAHVPVRID